MSNEDFVVRYVKAETTDFHDKVESIINREVLEPLVQQMLDTSNVSIVQWQCQEVKGGLSGSQVIRVSGTAKTDKDSLPWSLFLKILRRQYATQDFSELGWKREALAYQSGVLDNLAGGIEAATCYHINEELADEIWMWFEDLSGEADSPWSRGRYTLAARHLGQLNGYYLQKSPLPDYSWQLNHRDLDVVAREVDIEKFNQTKEHPVMLKIFPRDQHSMIYHFWEELGNYQHKLYEHLPQTFGHMDAGRYNLFSRANAEGAPSTVAIDWAFMGKDCIGKDLKHLVLSSLALGKISLQEARELNQTAYESYLDGLRDMGWDGDPRVVRYGYALSAAMHYMRFASTAYNTYVDESMHTFWEENIGASMEEIIDGLTEIYAFWSEVVKEGIDLDSSLF